MLSEAQTNVSENFLKISNYKRLQEIKEDFRGFPKTFEEDPKIFRLNTSKLISFPDLAGGRAGRRDLVNWENSIFWLAVSKHGCHSVKFKRAMRDL